MIFSKSKCAACKGTGVHDRHSYYLGSDLFFFALVELAFPVMALGVPLYLVFTFGGLDASQLLSYWRILAVSVVVVFLISISLVTPIIKKVMFGRCRSCGGTGKMKSNGI